MDKKITQIEKLRGYLQGECSKLAKALATPEDESPTLQLTIKGIHTIISAVIDTSVMCFGGTRENMDAKMRSLAAEIHAQINNKLPSEVEIDKLAVQIFQKLMEPDQQKVVEED